jgi:beta-lactamase class A
MQKKQSGMKRKCLWVLSILVLTVACEGGRPDRSFNAQPVTPVIASETAVNSAAVLESQLRQIASAVPGRVGVAATVLETGESVAVNGNEQFPMQSVYKVPIGMTVLHKLDQKEFSLKQIVNVRKSDFVGRGQHSPIRDRHPAGVGLSVGELLRSMISESDGTACDVLLGLVGGPKVVTDYLGELNIKNVIVASTEKEIGQDQSVQYRNWTSPVAAVVLLRAVQEGRGLSSESQKLLIKLMSETTTGLHRLKGGVPRGTFVAHKTGTSQTVNGLTAATNDIGIISLANGKHIAIAVFVSDSSASEATREAAIANIASAAWNYWRT